MAQMKDSTWLNKIFAPDGVNSQQINQLYAPQKYPNKAAKAIHSWYYTLNA